MTDAYSFNKDGAKRIVEAVRYIERSTKNNKAKRGRSALPTLGGFWTAKLLADDTISARQGQTPGEGEVTLEWYDDEEEEMTSGDEEITLTVKNNFRTEIEGDGTNDVYVQITYGAGAWWITAVDCNTEDAEEEEE